MAAQLLQAATLRFSFLAAPPSCFQPRRQRHHQRVRSLQLHRWSTPCGAGSLLLELMGSLFHFRLGVLTVPRGA